MPTVQEFAETFSNERVLQQALAKLLSKIPNHTGVQILQGSSEIGKDIIFYTPAAFGQKDLNACVVKNTKITGNASTSTGGRTVFNQAQQALDTPVLDENGHEQRVKRVFIITPYPISQETITSIVGALRANNGQVQFVSGAALLELFKLHWPDYLAEEFKLMQMYADTLANTAKVAKELEGLSFQYQLGTVDTSIKRVYVQPHLHRFIYSYSLRPLQENFPRPLLEVPYSEDDINSIKNRLSNIVSFVDTLKDWGLCEESGRRAVHAICSRVIAEITKSWSQALASRAAMRKGAVVVSDSFLVKLRNISELNQKLGSARIAINQALGRLEESIALIRQYVKSESSTSNSTLSIRHEEIINKLDEIARLSGPKCMVEEDEHHKTFSGMRVMEGPRALFIVAPAGFGKTSFCRWHALDDLEKLLQGESTTLPVYIPLHQVEHIESKDFKSAFLKHAGVSALLPKESLAKYDRTRVYLDGLDEVASPVTQKRIAELAQNAVHEDEKLQVIITARDYVYGPWMTWLPRIHLSGFEDEQVKELVSKWLENNETKISMFFEQLERSRPLKEMLSIPLLATLVVLVFKQTDKLPENKTRLYEIFVDLHNGGWDLVKGIQRPSHFSASEKMFVLKRIAAKIHKAKRREMLDSDVAQVARETFQQVDWKILRGELLRDGLMIELGSMIGFAHHSFQEFLTARHMLGDMNAEYLSNCCHEYLTGADWWQEVLCFYADLTGKPQEFQSWLDQRLKSVPTYPREKWVLAEERALFLKQHIRSSFPFART